MAESRGRGIRSLAAVLPKAAAPALRRRGFSAVEIVTRWPAIVGPLLGAETTPERIAFPHRGRNSGTLHIRATGSLALEIQHLAPLIVERVNTHFGYAAVERIALHQGAPATRPGPAAESPPPAAPDPDRLAALERRTRMIGDSALRTALNRLGGAVEGAAGPKPDAGTR